MHHMTSSSRSPTRRCEIVDADVVFDAHPHTTCPAIVEHYRGLVGLSIARGFTHRVRELLRRAARVHPHDGAAAGDGAGRRPVHVVDARAGATGSWPAERRRRPAPAGAAGEPRTPATSGPTTASRSPTCAPGEPMEVPLTMQRRFGALGHPGRRVAGTGPVEPTSHSLDVSVDDVRRRPGTKWASIDGRLAAWVADMDFPVAPAIRDALDRRGVDRRRLPALAGDRPVAVARALRRPHGGTVRLAARRRTAARAGRRDAGRRRDDPPPHRGRATGSSLHVPAYPPFLAAIDGSRPAASSRCRRELVDGRWTFDHDELDARLATEPARLLLLCHPHNPTGHVFDGGRADAARRDRRAATTSSWSATRSTPSSSTRRTATCRSPSLAPSVEARTVTVTSASKAFNLAGLRWAILHAGCAELQAALDALPSALPRRAQPDGGRGDRGGVDRRRRVAASRRRRSSTPTGTCWPSCCRPTCPTSATSCPTRRTSPGSTAGALDSATTRRRRSAGAASSSARARASGRRASASPASTSPPARPCSPAVVEAMAGATADGGSATLSAAHGRRTTSISFPRVAPSASSRSVAAPELARVVPVRRPLGVEQAHAPERDRHQLGAVDGLAARLLPEATDDPAPGQAARSSGTACRRRRRSRAAARPPSAGSPCR